MNTSGSITEPNTQYHELESDQERLRREYAGNYTQSLVQNAYQQVLGEQEQQAEKKSDEKKEEKLEEEKKEEIKLEKEKDKESTDDDISSTIVSSSEQQPPPTSAAETAPPPPRPVSPPPQPDETTKTTTNISPSTILTSTTTTIIESDEAHIPSVEDQTKILNRLVSSDRTSQISDELYYLLDLINTTSSTTSVTIEPSSGVSSHSFAASSYETKTYTFHKEIKPEQSEESALKQPSLAQIMESFKSSSSTSSGFVGDCIDSVSDLNKYPYAAPFALGIKLRPRAHPLEVGSHVISQIESNSPAFEAGMRAGSRLVRINEISCEDKTHEFVLFFLNYVLRKNSCDRIELTVDEPSQILAAPETTTAYYSSSQPQQSSTLSFSYDQNTLVNENDANSVSDATSIAEASEIVGLTGGHTHLRSIMSEAASYSNNLLKSTSSSSYYTHTQTVPSSYIEATANSSSSPPYLSVSTPAIYSTDNSAANNLSLYNTQSSYINAAYNIPPEQTTSTSVLPSALNTNTTSTSVSYYAPYTTTTTTTAPLTSTSSTVLSNANAPTTTSSMLHHPSVISSSSTSSTSGIENLKSIIEQITRIKHESTPTYVTTAYVVPTPSTSDNQTAKYYDDAEYETSIKISNVETAAQSAYQPYQPQPTSSTFQPYQSPQSELIYQTSNVDNLKTIFSEAINSNYNDYIRTRGILTHSKTTRFHFYIFTLTFSL